MSSMFYNASTFNQNLCGWNNGFPFDKATDIFTESGCYYIDTPTLATSSFCAVANCFTTNSVSIHLLALRHLLSQKLPLC
jgi:hypothetical protein